MICRARIAVALLFLIGFASRVCADDTSPNPTAGNPTAPLSDTRLGPLVDLNGYFPFEPSPSIEEWRPRAARRRTAILVSQGLWPMPRRTDPSAVVHGRLELDGYTVEKVFLESFPGFFVTGNLYRPAQGSGKRPGVLCPHGHFRDGRFGSSSLEDVQKEIEAGAELFENGGRNSIQSRCVQLARMGCVVFNYDMIGYCDSQQIPSAIAHGFAVQRPEMNGAEHWGFFSPQAESHLQSIMGLQTYNSIRALDWLLTLPDVDPDRIAVTGASGGGTQTFLLCAIDDRPDVAVPAVMVSTAMQGGCTCENACLLRVGAGNVEFASLIAPRPLCLISADDWTHEMATKGFPQIEEVYRQFDASEHVEHYPFLQFGHNYNVVSRGVMYAWLNRHFQLGFDSPIQERDYQRLGAEELTVWNEQHPAPASGPDFERQLLRTWTNDADAQLSRLLPHDAASLEKYRQVVGAAMDVIVGRRIEDVGQVEFDEKTKNDHGDHWQFSGRLIHRPSTEQTELVPVVCLVPKSWRETANPVAIWIDAQGKRGLFSDGKPRPEVQQLLDQKVAVVGVDLLEQGDARSGDGPLIETRRVANERESAAYTLGYNRSLFAQRVHDILTTIRFAADHAKQPSEVWLVGLDGAGHWAAAAAAQAREVVTRAAIDTDGFRFANVPSIRHPDLLPGGAKYFDLPGFLSLAAPSRLWIANEKPTDLSCVTACYQAADHADDLTISTAGNDDINRAALQWLLRKK